MSKLYTRCQNCREIYEKEKPYCPSCNTPTNYEDKTIKLIECPACKKEVSSEAPNCGQTINTKTKCPKCGSYNTKPISNSSKVISTIMWGALATNKVISKNECLNCKHKF